MAEAIARSLSQRGKFGPRDEIFVASAGLGAIEGAEPSVETVDSLQALGIEFDGRAKNLTRRMIERADLVLCMTAAHAAAVRRMVDHDPDQVGKISTLDPDGDIPDPIGLDLSVYHALAGRLSDLIPRRFEELLQR